MKLARWSMRIAALLAASALATACSGSGSGGGGSTAPTPPPNDPAFVCPSTGATPQAATAANTVRRRAPRREDGIANSSTLVGVLYDRGRFTMAREQMSAAEVRVGGRLVRERDYPRINQLSRVIALDPAKLPSAIAALAREPGVKRVERAGVRYATAVTTP